MLRAGRWFAASALWLLLIGGAVAEDAVYLSTPGNPQGTVKHVGRVIDFTGRELTMETEGRERRFPADQVARIESDWTEPHDAADELFAKHDFEAALKQYEAALKAEKRLWVERKIASQMILSLRNLNQTRRAGELFLTLLRNDPATPYFATIPIVWTPGQATPDLEAQARQWLASDVPAARLLGASALLSTNRRAAILQQLEDLAAASKDPRIVAIARGLIWSATFTGASDNKLRAWGDEAERFPPSLQAGPYFVLGRALLQQKHLDEAALALLRAPLVYPDDRTLAAQALLLAGRALDETAHADEAALVFGELLAEYPQSRAATELRANPKFKAKQVAAPRLLAASAPGVNADARFLDALRLRRLYRLAEKFCRDRLERKELAEPARTELTVELSRTLVDEALQAEGAARDQLFQKAIAAAADLIQAAPKNPRLAQLRVQQGLVERAWGELLRQEFETTGVPHDAFEPARKHLRAAIAALREAATSTTEALRMASTSTRKPAPGDWTPAELRALDKNIQYQTARALRSLAESYPAESADRSSALAQAVDLLGPLSQLDVNEPIAWSSRLDAATCQRLLGNLESATRRLDQIIAEEPPERIAARALAERLRVAIMERRMDQAIEALDKWRGEEHAPLADLDYAALEIYLARWQAAHDSGDTALSAQWQKRAEDAVTAFENAHGAYWGRRAEALLANRAATRIGAGDAATLARAAEGFYRAGQKSEAVAAYDRAVAAARKGAQLSKAFEWEYTAAAIEQEQKHFSAAADRFRQAAIAQPTVYKAADAHLLAIYNQGQHAQQKNDAAAIARYAEMLEEHVDKWPAGPSADRAHVLLARVREREKRWPQAAEQYAAVHPASESAAEALDGLARSHEAALAVMRASGKPTDQAAKAAIVQIEQLAGVKPDTAAPANDSQRSALLAAGRILMEYTNSGAQQAERLVSLALANSAKAPAEWKLSAEGLLLCAIAAQGRADDAVARIAPLTEADPRAIVPIIDSLDRQAATAAPELRRNLAKVELRLMDLALRNKSEAIKAPETSAPETSAKAAGEKKTGAALDADTIRRLQLLRGSALIAAGHDREGVAEVKRLAAANPRDGHTQEALARALFDTNNEGAAAAWQTVEEKSRPGGERWLRAKYYQAQILERRGEKQRAAQMVKMLALRYPALGGGEQQEKFEQLLKRCQ